MKNLNVCEIISKKVHAAKDLSLKLNDLNISAEEAKLTRQFMIKLFFINKFTIKLIKIIPLKDSEGTTIYAKKIINNLYMIFSIIKNKNYIVDLIRIDTRNI